MSKKMKELIKRNILALKYLFKPEGLPCMFDHKWICSPKTCQGFSQESLRYCIYTESGKEVCGPCQQLAAMSAAAHYVTAFEKKVVREMIKMDLGEVLDKKIKEAFKRLT